MTKGTEYHMLIVSETAIQNSTQKDDVREEKKPSATLRKIMTAQCNQFSSKAELIQVFCRCNNPEIPNVTATALHVSPSRCAPRRKYLNVFIYCFLLMLLQDTMLRLRCNKMRDANCLRDVHIAVLLNKYPLQVKKKAYGTK